MSGESSCAASEAGKGKASPKKQEAKDAVRGPPLAGRHESACQLFLYLQRSILYLHGFIFTYGIRPYLWDLPQKQIEYEPLRGERILAGLRFPEGCDVEAVQ